MLNEFYLSDDIEKPVLASSILSYVTPNVSGKRFHELKTGDLPWEAKLDLSDLQPEEARNALLEFIQKQAKNNRQCLLIIHGTEGSKNNFPLLKNLINHWLPQIREVAAFHSAKLKDGGIRAVYVLLNRTLDFPIPTRIEKGTSFLVAETFLMEQERRQKEQQGHSQLAKVNMVEHHEPRQQTAPEGELQNDIKQHPDLDNPRMDGIDPNENPEPALNSDARTEYDNAKREQQLELQMRLGLMPKMGSTPEFKP